MQSPQYFHDALPNAKGKLTKVSSTTSTTEYTAFDVLGRVTAHRQTTDGQSYTTGYGYNLSGAMTEETYPSGRVVKNVLDNDGDLAMVQSKKNGNSGYFNYARSFSYTAAGAVSSMQLGNGRWESTSFNSRLQPMQIALGGTPNATNLLKLNFDYGTTQNNGNVLSQQITVPDVVSGNQVYNGFTATQVYTYDSLNRLKSAEETIPSQTGWKQTFLYDRYGNRNFDTANNNTTTIPAGCATAVCNPQVDPNTNKLIGYVFDDTGNTKTDANGRQFIYDAENKQKLVKESNNNIVGEYFYDGDGKRVKKIALENNQLVTTVFVYDAGGKLVAEYANPITTTIPQVSYLTSDHLGSPRINTDANGTVTARHDYLPFGEEIARPSYGNDEVRKQFTGYEKDAETDLDFAQARMYSYSHGRFTSPDNFVNDTHSSDPQSWNLYSYVRNNPLKFIDSNGEKATVTIKTDEKNKTGTITITATIAIWTSNQNITATQMNTAAVNMEKAIESGWSGTFVKDGITYTVKADVSIDASNGRDEKASTKSGADNVIEMVDVNTTGEASRMDQRNVGAYESTPDTGRWNIQESLNSTQEPGHEFGHGMGLAHPKSGQSLMNTSADMTRQMVQSDFDRFGGIIDSHRSESCETKTTERGGRGGWSKTKVGSPRNDKSARVLTMWNYLGMGQR